MKAIDVIEAESPKHFVKQVMGDPATPERIGPALEKLGFEQRAPLAGAPTQWAKYTFGTQLVVQSVGREAIIQISELRHGPMRMEYVGSLRAKTFADLMAKIRSLTVVESVLSLDPAGGLSLDARPKAPNSIWTHQRKDDAGDPNPYRRTRTLANGKPFEMFVAYRKDRAPSKLLSLAKQYGPEIAQMARRGADDLAHALSGAGISMVVPLPSGKPLARRFARLLANRLGVPMELHVEKSERMRAIPISKRRMAAQRAYSATGGVRGQTILIVDDYVVTSASQMAAAEHLYQAGARRVIGAALAI